MISLYLQFQLDCNESAFKFDHVCGNLAPRTRRTVVIKFAPEHAINYYRRVPVLVHNQVNFKIYQKYNKEKFLFPE